MSISVDDMESCLTFVNQTWGQIGKFELIPLISVLLAAVACTACKTNDHFHPDLDVKTSNLKKTAEFLTSIRPYRNYKNTKVLNRIAQYIEEHFSEYGLTTEIQTFEVDGQEYKNVIGTVGPERPNRIIIGAHYDVCGDQAGADDNASAVAGLLEIARIVRELALDSDYRFDFVAYSLEEPPFFGTDKMGSYVHARSLHDGNVNVVGMICLEMIGFFSAEKNSQKYPLGIMKLFYPAEGNFIAIVGNLKSASLVKAARTHMRATAIETRSLTFPPWIPGVNLSDHKNYWKFGYKAVMITDTAFYRNANYHQVTDTVDTLDFDKMKEVVKGVVWTLLNWK